MATPGLLTAGPRPVTLPSWSPGPKQSKKGRGDMWLGQQNVQACWTPSAGVQVRFIPRACQNGLSVLQAFPFQQRRR